MNARIKVVLFDHGGVLMPSGVGGTNVKVISQITGLPREIINVTDLNYLLKTGRITNEQYVVEINRRYPDAPQPLTMAMWGAPYRNLEPSLPAYEFVNWCRANGFRTGILSNTSPAMADWYEANGRYYGFFPVVLSCRVGYAKPDPVIYELTERAIPDVRPDEILFLDDQEKCMPPAQARGWQTIRVVSPEQMIEDASRVLLA